jgi:hypothetical protein
MHWKDVEALHLKVAMFECEKLGLAAFREKYGFGRSNAVAMWKDGRGPFEARCLIAAAFADQFHGYRVTPKAFTSTSAQDYLVKVHGFTAKKHST